MKFDGLIRPIDDIYYDIPLYSLKIIFDNYGKSNNYKYDDHLKILEGKMYENGLSTIEWSEDFNLDNILVLLMNAKDNINYEHEKHYKKLKNLILEAHHNIPVLEDII